MADKVVCPRCGAVLEGLIAYLYTKAEQHDVELKDGKLVYRYIDEIEADKVEFVCPKCGAVIAESEEELRKLGEGDDGYLFKPNECPSKCPRCGSTDIASLMDPDYPTLTSIIKHYECLKCGFEWEEVYEFVEWRPRKRD